MSRALIGTSRGHQAPGRRRRCRGAVDRAAPAWDLTAWSGPWGISYPINLTPDENTGIGIWTEEIFVKAMRTGRHMGTSRPILPPMPWQSLAALNDAGPEGRLRVPALAAAHQEPRARGRDRGCRRGRPVGPPSAPPAWGGPLGRRTRPARSRRSGRHGPTRFETSRAVPCRRFPRDTLTSDSPVRTEAELSLVAVVGTTSKGDVPNRGLTPGGMGFNVMELQEAPLAAAAAALRHESATPAVSQPDGALDLAGMWREPRAVRRLCRGCSLAPSFFLASSSRSADNARSKISAGSPSGIWCLKRSCASRSFWRVSALAVKVILYWSGASGATTGRRDGGWSVVEAGSGRRRGRRRAGNSRVGCSQQRRRGRCRGPRARGASGPRTGTGGRGKRRASELLDLAPASSGCGRRAGPRGSRPSGEAPGAVSSSSWPIRPAAGRG